MFLKIFPIIILLGGLSGNILGLITLMRKKMHAIGTRNMHQYLFISDTFYLSLIIPLILREYGTDLMIKSNIICKGFWYLTGAISIISPMILIYISFDRYISLKYLNKKELLRSNLVQLVYILVVVLANASFFLILPFSFSIQSFTLNETNITVCNFNDKNIQMVIMNMDIGFRTLFPFVLMVIASGLLIYLIIMSGRRVLKSNSNENKRFKRDIKFAASSISLNLVYIILNMPVSLVLRYVYSLDNDIFVVLYFIYFTRSGINFYLLLLTNSLFNNEFKSLIVKRKSN